jgi:hypothetical protein
MKRFLVVAAVLVAGSQPAAAYNASLTKQLESHSGATRCVTPCGLQALIEIGKAERLPAGTPVDALAAPHVEGDTMTGNGGALRSRDKWYQFSFSCVTTPDHLQVTSFEYKIGKPIPEEQWASLNLYK